MDIDSIFHGNTTLICSTLSKSLKSSDRKFLTHGTGFYYHVLSDTPVPNTKFREIKNMSLVTNRHVLFKKIDGVEYLPDDFEFNLRKVRDNKISWEPIHLDATEVQKRTKVAPIETIDVAVIDVHDLIVDKVKESTYPDIRYISPFGVNKEQTLGNTKIPVEVGDDVLVIGYPYGYYDVVNCFPIVKSGTVASSLYNDFNGEPYFLVHAKLFPGSSGSLVISKPTNVISTDGRFLYSKEKQFAFLGIFSSNPYVKILENDEHKPSEAEFDVGKVWYGRLIEKIIERGISFREKK